MDLDYAKLGFKCGVEIHQQLETHKLFCPCPSLIREDEPDLTVERKMRAVAGELGEVDQAALHEFLKDRTLLYQAYKNTTCLVELDEEPPHPLNMEALETVLQVALMLNAKIVDELQVMRKTVIDGSNTCGFQRTILVGMNGKLKTSENEMSISTICLEEDAARKISEKDNRVVYRLDRLGIPLIEIGTTPDIKNPSHAREVAEKIGLILRATGKVKRGLGTIRQDLNVSIAGGERIEVKGVQELRLIPKVVENEVRRQVMLIEVKEKLKANGVKEEDIRREKFTDVSNTFKDTSSTVIRKTLDKKGVVLAVRLPGFSGLLNGKLGPEIAQYVKAVASVPGFFHSDELPAYGVSEDEVKLLGVKLNLKEKDAFALVAEEKEKAEKALKVIVNRCVQAIHGVPEETRRALEDGATEYMRPLPGSARMYPETDEPLVVVDDVLLEKASVNLPELPEEKVKRFIAVGLSPELASQLSRSEKCFLFEDAVKKFPKLKPSIIATVVFLSPKEAEKRFGLDASVFTDQHFNEILQALDDGLISKEAVPEILSELAKKPEASVKKILSEQKLGLLSEKEIHEVVSRIVSENKKTVSDLGREKAFNQLMGKTMAALKGRGNAQTVRKILEEKLKE